jgi:hypothetical protein
MVCGGDDRLGCELLQSSSLLRLGRRRVDRGGSCRLHLRGRRDVGRLCVLCGLS